MNGFTDTVDGFSLLAIQALQTYADEKYINDTPPEYTPKYFIDTTATGTGDGLSEANAFTTMAQINAVSLVAGDVVGFKAGQIFDDTRLTVTDGDVGNEIIYTSYGSGANPILTFDTTFDVAWSDQGSGVWRTTNTVSSDPKRLWVDGVEQFRALDASEMADGGVTGDWRYESSYIYLNSTTNPASKTILAPQSNYVSVSSISNIIFYGLDFRRGIKCFYATTIENTTFNYCGIGYDCSAGLEATAYIDTTITNNTVDANNELYYTNVGGTGIDTRGTGDGITMGLGGGSHDVVINNNTFKNWGHASLGLSTTGSGVYNIEIKYNLFTSPDISYGGRVGYSGDIYNVEVAYNVFDKVAVKNQFNGHDNNVHHNIFSNSLNSPMKDANLGAAISVEHYNGDIYNNVYENNVAYNCDGSLIEIIGTNTGGVQIYDNIFRNNIGYECATDDTYGQGNRALYLTRYIDIGDNDYINNIVHSTFTDQTVRYNNVNMTLAQFNADTQHPTDIIENNLDTDPQFTDAPNDVFTVPPGSPAIGNGVIPLSTIDYAGTTISSPYNIGLYDTPKA